MPWSIDPVHTHVSFSVRHMMVATVRGQFKQFRGTVKLDPQDFTRSSFEGELDVASVDTGNEQRDEHLRTSDFFDAPNHPKITFKSTRVERKGDDEYLVHGDMTIRGVTKPITLDVEFHGVTRNPWGQTVAGVTAKATIQRKDFGVSYNAVLEAGGVAIGEKVKVEIDAELIAPQVAATEPAREAAVVV